MTVIRFPLDNTNYSPKEALDVVKEKEDVSDVLVLFYQEGALCINSSRLTHAEALFMIEMAKKEILDV